jgi:acyl-CoA synthetase (AMP-forming)/AMP-acid ligase II
MPELTVLSDALDAAAQSQKKITFIESRDEETYLTYTDLKVRALLSLGLLQQKGLKPGDELILFLKDNRSFIEMYWACILGGIIPVPVAVGISDEHRGKLFRIFNKLERPHLYTDKATLQKLKTYSETFNLEHDFTEIEQKTINPEETISLSNTGEPYQANPEDTAFIQFSSGSTSDPKGVVLTHKNILTNIRGIINAGAFSSDDISLSWMPLTHDMGLIGFHLNMLACNMDQYLMPTDLFSRRPLLWLQKASETKASILCSPNFGYKHYLKALGDKTPDSLQLSSVRLIYNGAEPISIPLCFDFLERLAPYGLKQQSMYTVYGLAEASLAVSFPKAGETLRALDLHRHHLGMEDTIKQVSADDANAMRFAIEGKPVPGCEVRIANDSNLPLDENHIGTIQIRGDNVMQGYYKDELSNATTLVGDGWVDTGDLGFLSNGELIVTGRLKDIIFAHGLNYYPHDLEALIHEYSDLELGKVVVTSVRQPEDTEDELLVFILFRKEVSEFLPHVQKTSHIINEQTGLEVTHVIPVKRIPKTTSGKVQRRLLAEAFQSGEFEQELEEIRALHDQQQAATDGDLSEMEASLKQIVDSVVTDKSLGIHENFFDSGISSLALAEIHQRIDDQWPDKIDVVDLFDHQTVAEVARFLEAKLKE